MPKNPLEHNPIGDWIPEMLAREDAKATPPVVEQHPAAAETQKVNETPAAPVAEVAVPAGPAVVEPAVVAPAVVPAAVAPVVPAAVVAPAVVEAPKVEAPVAAVAPVVEAPKVVVPAAVAPVTPPAAK